MVDKIKPLKMESPAGGGTEFDMSPTEVDPSEDYSAVKGVAFEDSDSTLLDLSAGGEIQWIDSVQTTPMKLNDTNQQALAARYTIVLQHNGSVRGGTFIGFDSLIPGDATPVVIPIDSVFKGFAFSNAVSTADYTLYLRKNSTVATAFFSVSKVNTQFFAQTVTDESFSQGDRIYIEYQDDGRNARDVGITLFFQASI